MFVNFFGIWGEYNGNKMIRTKKQLDFVDFPGAHEENDDPEAQMMILHPVNHDVCTIWTLHLPTFARVVFIEAYGVVLFFWWIQRDSICI